MLKVLKIKKFTEDKKYRLSFLIVLISGLIWSFGAVIVRHMENSHNFLWEYLIVRSLSMSVFLLFFLLLRGRRQLFKSLQKIQKSSFVGAICLSVAFVGFIASITSTTAAVTLFMLAAMPFLAALLGFIILQEKLKPATLMAMCITFLGILVMIGSELQTGSISGAIFGLLSSLGFAGYAVSLRWNPKTPKLATIILAGFICAIFSFLALLVLKGNFEWIVKNIQLSILHGLVITLGMVCFNLGAKRLPAAEIGLLSITEVVFGILWVWIPFFGVEEQANYSTLLGGAIIILGIIFYALKVNKKKTPYTLFKHPT